MSLSPTSRWSTTKVRWAVPAVAAALVGGAVAVPALATASPDDVPTRSAAQLLVDLSGNTTTALSGTVVQTSRLGFPELPGAATTGPMSLTSGSNTLRVWADGPERARVALLGDLAEYDVVRSGRDAWTYSSQQDEVVHYTLPAESRAGSAEDNRTHPGSTGRPTGLPSTPAEAADAVLRAIDPTTDVAVEKAVTVAGRTARQLVLTPADTSSLVGSVRLAVDVKTSAPLRVQVFAAAKPELPAFEVGFTDVSFTAPDPSVFTFTPPPGATVREVAVPTGAKPDTTASKPGAHDGDEPQLVGEGWTSVLVMDGVDTAALTEAQGPLLDQLTKRVPEGRLLSTALVSVLLTDDGRVLVGAVQPEVLQDAA